MISNVYSLAHFIYFRPKDVSIYHRHQSLSRCMTNGQVSVRDKKKPKLMYIWASCNIYSSIFPPRILDKLGVRYAGGRADSLQVDHPLVSPHHTVGNMGRLVIAHHKSYHPYKAENIERVRRDEEEARLKEAKEEGRLRLVVSALEPIYFIH
jgi:hypothetical protein